MKILRPLPTNYPVEYRDCFRMLAAISGFKRQFGRWPTRLKVNPSLFEYVAKEILTPQAIDVLKKKIEIEFVVDLFQSRQRTPKYGSLDARSYKATIKPSADFLTTTSPQYINH